MEGIKKLFTLINSLITFFKCKIIKVVNINLPVMSIGRLIFNPPIVIAGIHARK